ncbi:hypothetical protein APHAL10511_005366 [Amanita phalloides]|nr:hypothetical protein APHAL10511_005366 [Amanita phalloides]
MDSHDDNVSSSPTFSEPPPFPSSTQRPTSAHSLRLSDLLGQTFLQFDHRTTIVEPFLEEAERAKPFQEDVAEMLLDAIVEAHAWSTAWYKGEDINAVARFEQEISGIIEIEKEQERTREHLMEFVNHLKNAIAALTATMML